MRSRQTRQPLTTPMRAFAAGLALLLCTAGECQDTAFISTQGLPQASGNASAIALPNGDALVFGSAPVAQRFDHASNSMLVDGALLQSHVYTSAQALASGEVLLASGTFDPTDASAELYDPATRSSHATGSMSTGRWNAAVSPLTDGRVLFAGGTIDYSGTPTDSIELYDRGTGRFSAAGHMARPRAYATATQLPDGTVLVAGGLSNLADVCPHSNGIQQCSAEVCDPARGVCTPTGDMSEARWSSVATALADGRVLISGGWTEQLSSQRWADGFQIYDPVNGTFSAAGAGTGQQRLAHTATRLPNGGVLLAGGVGLYSNVLATSAVFDPVALTVRPGPNLVASHDSHAAVLLADGRVLVAGGETYDAQAQERTATADAELFVHDGVFSDGFDGSG